MTEEERRILDNFLVDRTEAMKVLNQSDSEIVLAQEEHNTHDLQWENDMAAVRNIIVRGIDEKTLKDNKFNAYDPIRDGDGIGLVVSKRTLTAMIKRIK